MIIHKTVGIFHWLDHLYYSLFRFSRSFVRSFIEHFIILSWQSFIIGIITKLQTGRQKIPVTKQNVQVKRGFFLAFVNTQSQSSSQIYLKKTKTQTLHWNSKNFESDLINNQQIGLFPSIQTVSIQPISIPIRIRPTSYENIIIEVVAKNTKNSAEKKKVLLIGGNDEIQVDTEHHTFL